MNTLINDGGPAYPVTEVHGCNSGWPGMSLRDHFAGLAMQGLMSNKSKLDEPLVFIAKNAYQIADAMITERST